MNKKIFLLTLLALAAGVLLGYTGKSLKRDAETIPPPSTAGNTGARPRFGDSLTSAPRPSAAVRSKQTTETLLDKDLKRYSRMSHEELLKEVEKLNKKRFSFYSSESVKSSILISFLCSRLGQESPRQTLQQMADFKGYGSWLKYNIMNAWTMKNPEAAMAYCRENISNDQENNRFLYNGYISMLTKQSPDKALDYLASLPLKEQSSFLYEPLSGLLEKTPEKMAEAVSKLTPAILKSNWAHNQIAGFWAREDWNAAAQWMDTLPAEKKAEALSHAVSVLPLEEATQKLDSLTGKAKEEALKRISIDLLRESPQKAVELLQAHATEEEAVKAIEKNYYNFDFLNSEGIAYIEQMPSGSLKDSLLTKIAGSVYPGSRETIFLDKKMEDSLSMASKISSPQKKEQAIERALTPWIYNDPEKTKSWLEKSDIPSEKKTEYMKRCDEYLKQLKEADDTGEN